jgi:hypothetical protein
MLSLWREVVFIHWCIKLQNMLDIKVRGALEQVIDQFVSSFPTTVSSLREGYERQTCTSKMKMTTLWVMLMVWSQLAFMLPYWCWLIDYLTQRRKRKLTRLSIIELMSSETPYLRVDDCRHWICLDDIGSRWLIVSERVILLRIWVVISDNL